MSAPCESLYPVVLPVPDRKQELCRKALRRYLSWLARRAVARSAERAALDGIGLPAAAIYWSLTHKPAYVAGIAASCPTGIDVEKIRPVSGRLMERAFDASERSLFDEGGAFLFFRIWTAKEAILKQTGAGLAGLCRCRIIGVSDARSLVASYQNWYFEVEQLFFDQHVAAVVKKRGQAVRWCFD
ncbi:MAG: 4'-phosphopantetheinyl transferase superfamily protein [Desulfosalsimonadaceae bacterium]